MNMRALLARLRSRWRTLARRRGAAPIAEAEALLAGRYLEYLVRQRQPIPAWAALNAAAHGDLELVHRIAGRAGTGRGRPGDPLAGEVVIAETLFRHVGDDHQLFALTQAMLLVPLELQMMNAPPGARPAPRQVVETACALIGATPGTHP